MKPTPPNLPRARAILCLSLAASLAAPTTYGQTDPALRQLQEENAALRRRIAELEGRNEPRPAPPPTTTAPSTSASTVSPVATTTATPGGEEVMTLTPFEVKSDKDYGYLRTNSATATRIGVAIQTVPLSVSVISEDFIKDFNLSDIQDVLRFQASSSGDTRMGVLQPATGFTPSGNMSLRGFPINSRLRNGLLRYNNYSLDNVDRVEIIKGPAAVFFGQAFPGGVLNYVTKQPEFRNIPTTATYSYGGYDTRMGSQRATFDHNNKLSDKAALRVVGAWDNALGDRRFEFQEGFSVTPTLAFRPLSDSRLKVTLEAEFVRRKRNQDDTSWTWPEQWFRDYANPPANLIAAAGLSGNANPVEAYRTRIFSGPGNWIADRRTAANDQSLPLWTEPMKHGAYITDRAGNRVFDSKFNYYGSGTYSDEENTTATIATEASPTKWLDLRHTYTHDDARYTEVKSSASPNADGITWQTMNGILARDYIREARTHQLDLVFKQRLFDVNHKVLIGGLHSEANNAFTGTNAANLAGTGQFPFFGNLPGTFDKPDEGYVSPIPAQFRSTSFAGNFNQEYVRNRTGRILSPTEIFSLYDPGVHPFPDIRRITEVSRGLIDRSRPTRKEKYVNYQASALQDRLTVMLGYREEKQTTVGQLVEANPPWFTVPEYALQNVPQAQWAQYGLSAIFSRPRTTKGESKMAGLSFAVVKDVNVYASYSETFLPSGVTYIGGDYDPATVAARATSLGLNPTTELARLEAQGGLRETVNEKGKNYEFGVKTSLLDNKIVSTLSFYRLERENRTIDDGQRQFDEVLNWTGPGRTGTNNRIVRWYSNDAVQRTEGTELELIWTPVRNFQVLASASWMWTAETVSDKSLDITPTSSAAAIATRNIIFGNRLPFAPEYRLNIAPKYTFTDNLFGNFGRGASVGGSVRYSSDINIALDQNTNPGRGGLTAGDYVVFDAFFSVPVNVLGYNLNLSLNVNNVTDKEYSEGGFNLSAPRSWLLTTGMKF